MKLSTLIQYVPLVAAFFLPLASSAAVQNMDGGSAVYLDYPEGQDEIIVDNFTAGKQISWDIYTSATPEEKNSWELSHTYQANDQILTDEYYYGIMSGRALEFNGDYYFMVEAQTSDGVVTAHEESQIWRVTKRGEEPHRVLSMRGGGIRFGSHMPLVVLGERLVTIDYNGDVYESLNGTSWTLTTNIADQFDDFFLLGDFVSNGKTAFLSKAQNVYSSKDAHTWTLIGNPCGEIVSCEVGNLVPRAKKGVIAAATLYSMDGTTTTLSVYAKHAWTQGADAIAPLTTMELINGHIYAMQQRGEAASRNAIKEITPHAEITTVRSARNGSAYAIFSDHLAMMVLQDASYISLVKY